MGETASSSAASNDTIPLWLFPVERDKVNGMVFTDPAPRMKRGSPMTSLQLSLALLH